MCVEGRHYAGHCHRGGYSRRRITRERSETSGAHRGRRRSRRRRESTARALHALPVILISRDPEHSSTRDMVLTRTQGMVTWTSRRHTRCRTSGGPGKATND